MPDPKNAVPEPKAQRNFTDMESRIMADNSNKGAYIQGYNAQIVVDSKAQVILAANLTQDTNDKRQLVPMLQEAEENLLGERPKMASADCGYHSETAVESPKLKGIDLYVPPDRMKHVEADTKSQSQKECAKSMRAKLQTQKGHDVYRMRKAIVEPVFGQIKEVRGLRAFLLRGLDAARAEWRIICLTHNLLKLYKCGGWSLLTMQFNPT